MIFSKSKKPHNLKKYRDPEGFRKRALFFALFMAISGFFFLGAVLYFTGHLEIIL